MFKIALCDDNRDSVEQYARLIKNIAEKHQIPIELSYFYSGESLLFHYMDNHKQVDIIYLDILMGRADGMETAQKLRESGCKAQIVFLTSYEDYVFSAFDVNAVHYLLKEKINAKKFEDVFLQVIQGATKKSEELFRFDFNGVTQVIPFSQITYFEIWKRLVTVHYHDGMTAKFYSSMEQLEQRLGSKNFARAHRSYLVNLAYIAKLQQQNITLKTGDVIPVGSPMAAPCKKRCRIISPATTSIRAMILAGRMIPYDLRFSGHFGAVLSCISALLSKALSHSSKKVCQNRPRPGRGHGRVFADQRR